MCEVREFRLKQERDRLGNLEEFTSDSYLIVESTKTVHLNHNGLPQIGTIVIPGMCLIAKYGATEAYEKARTPTDLESLTKDESFLIEKYGGMFYDASLYVPSGVYGVVERSGFLEHGETRTAVVEVRLRQPDPADLGSV